VPRGAPSSSPRRPHRPRYRPAPGIVASSVRAVHREVYGTAATQPTLWGVWDGPLARAWRLFEHAALTCRSGVVQPDQPVGLK
jgi:hypothetical protein